MFIEGKAMRSVVPLFLLAVISCSSPEISVNDVPGDRTITEVASDAGDVVIDAGGPDASTVSLGTLTTKYVCTGIISETSLSYQYSISFYSLGTEVVEATIVDSSALTSGTTQYISTDSGYNDAPVTVIVSDHRWVFSLTPGTNGVTSIDESTLHTYLNSPNDCVNN